MVRHIHRTREIILGLVLLLVLPHSTQAHNGSVAVAVPLEGITVDGDFADWPEGMEQYPVAVRQYGDRPYGEDDFLGFFRIGYSAAENVLYVAAEMGDDDIMLDPGANQWVMEGCGLGLEVGHVAEDVTPIQHSIRGQKHEVYGMGNLEHATVEVQRQEGVHRYEWKIDIGAMSDNSVQLAPAMTIGFELGLFDADPDSRSIMAWDGGNSLFHSRFLGDLVLVGSAPEIGSLRGKVRWQGRDEAAGRAHLWIRSQDIPTFWLAAVTGHQGRFDLELPAGVYSIETDRRTDGVPTVDVLAGRTVEIALEKQFPTGISVKAGKGRTAAAGGGTRRGLWHTLDLADGLPDAAVVSVLQDRQGFMWFGTPRGICRYDGAQFRIFTTDDGLLDNGAETIFQDERGHFWFAGSTLGLSIFPYGATRYDGKKFTHFSTLDGLISDDVRNIVEDQHGNLWFATRGGVSRFDGYNFTNFTIEDGLVDNDVTGLVEDRRGNLWFATQGGVSRYHDRQDVGETFTNFTALDGLASDEVISLCADGRGHLWFGTRGAGVSRYDDQRDVGQQFTTFTTEDNLANDAVLAITEDDEGHLWFGTDVGVSRFNGEIFTTFLPEDGLAYDQVWVIEKDNEGNLWFGTGGWSESGGGVSRYDGGQLTTYTKEEGLGTNGILSLEEDGRGHLWFGGWGNGPPTRYDGKRLEQLEGMGNEQTWAIREDRKGHLWFGTFPDLFYFDGESFLQGPSVDDLGIDRVKSIFRDSQSNLWFMSWDGKLCRHDGVDFETITSEDGLPDAKVKAIAEDEEGNLWFATEGGASRYDGEKFTNFIARDGLPNNVVEAIAAGPDGDLWFGMKGGLLCRYNGEQFTDFATAENVGDMNFYQMMVDRRGHLWYSVYGGGITRYDGRVFQRLLKRDGLTHDAVQEILQARNGDIWIATEGGVTRYRDRRTSPPVEIVDVVANRAYGPISTLSIPTTQAYLSIQFKGRSFKTRPGQMVYLYRLHGHDADWQQTREEKAIYADLPRGEYLFQVQVVDRDLNYSEKPAEVRVSVHLPYERLALMTGLGLALVGFIVASGYGFKRRRDLRRAEQALMRELEEELQVAHDLQMELMPTESPQIEDFDISGCCIPFNHVGGDFFQYFEQDGKLAICMADVTGHAMEAAVPVMMFSGILESQIEHGGNLEDLFSSLNRILSNKLDSRTFVCFTMGKIELSTRAFHLANGGCPSPYHYRASTGQVTELDTVAYPLGVRADTRYSTIETQLELGDYVVFCSDGIIEMSDPSGEFFGFERTTETIHQGCAEDLSAEALIDRLIGTVQDFAGDVPQGDDITVVVLRVEA